MNKESETLSFSSEDMFSRSRLLLGEEVFSKLRKARVIIFGVGGVGSWCAESLIRSGLGNLTLVDDDVVAPSNINRQAQAFQATVGMPKVEEMAQILKSINPSANVLAINRRFTPENATEWQLSKYDYIVDAIDSIENKVFLMLEGSSAGKATKLYSSMGAALKIDPTQVEVEEFRKVTGCRLARALRDRFKRMGQFPSGKIMCAFSAEPCLDRTHCNHGAPNGSAMPVTATFGLTLSSLIIKDLIRGVKTSGENNNGKS